MDKLKRHQVGKNDSGFINKPLKNHHMKYREEIDSTEYGFISGILEPEVNVLVFDIEFGRPADFEENVMIGKHNFGPARKIIIDDNSAKYRIRFDGYIGYSVIDEGYADKGSEDFIGKYFRIYSNSNYLEFISKETFATHDYPGEFKHYGFLAENHVIDIVSHYEPKIEKLN